MVAKMNSKAWIKIAEAFFAVTLILGVLVLFYSTTVQQSGREERVHSLEKTLLEEVSNDNSLREAVIKNESSIIDEFAKSRIEKILPGFNVSIKICDPNTICNLGDYKPEVYSEERIISSTLTEFSPKKLKIFIWLEK